ncbi:MAG TPA: TIGR00730 family Rossman fold protein [Tepidisphaeraceae bacterium]|jgi:hypothetical protein|nr:TIGR00730 family Rossman fold protein [Tepidisphaeraceae bacterium]
MSVNRIQSVTVYCSSHREVARVYFDAAAELGRAIAAEKWNLVYGGNDCGCMGALAHAARDAGGRVIGVTPQLLVDNGIADEKCDELVVTANMRERKAILELRGDAFIALPGGLGTLEEIFEILVGRTLGYHAKPVVLLNTAGFYDPLLAMLEHGVEQKFIKPKAKQHLQVSNTVQAAMEYLRGQNVQ